MTPSSSRPIAADCSACCGLCCVGPAFDRSQGFAYDKPPYRACRHLGRDDRCCIHDRRSALGFVACGDFDCYGAGQWVTQRIFGGRSWRDSPALAQAMFETYRRFRAIHVLLAGVRRVAPALEPLVLAAAAQEESVPGSVDLRRLRETIVTEAGKAA